MRHEIKKVKKEEEAKLIKQAACEMEKCGELWKELRDWDTNLITKK